MTRFALLRHARTEWNQENRIQGHNNSPLTPEGENQARAWGQLLKKYQWNRIITSDLGRALETTELVNASLNLPVIYDSRLREQDWGLWAGKKLVHIRKEASQSFTEMRTAGWRFCPPAGENRHAVWERSKNAIKEADEKWPGEKILIVTHEGVIKCLIYHLYGRRFLSKEPPLLLSSHLHWLVHGKGGLRVGEINALKLSP